MCQLPKRQRQYCSEVDTFVKFPKLTTNITVSLNYVIDKLAVVFFPFQHFIDDFVMGVFLILITQDMYVGCSI